MKKTLLLVICCLWLCSLMQVMAQQVAISGVVKDKGGEPLPGVNILVKGTTSGTITDFDGVFNLSVDETAILVFNFVGFQTQEVPVLNKRQFQITLLEDLKEIDEVVVVGYGTQKKVNLTGSVATIASDKLESRPISNTMEALQGAMPGVVVTRGSGAPGKEEVGIQIRGVTSVNGSGVLVMVDGVQGTLSDLNPNDIETISVLKDAAAAAIYGSRAAGGVVLVTTKKGTKGKPKFEFSSLVGVTTPGNMPERIPSWEEFEMHNIALVNSGANKAWSDEQIEWTKDPSVTWRINPTNPNVWDYYDNVDWISEGTKKHSMMQNHNLSVRGGGENGSYSLSYGYYQREGILKYGPDQNERHTIRLNNNYKFNDYITLDTRLSYRGNQIEEPSQSVTGDYGLLYSMYQIRSIYSVYNPNGGYNGALSNPVATMKEGGKKETKSNLFDASAHLTISNLVKGLTFNVLAGKRMEFDQLSTIKRTIVYLGAQDKPIRTDNPANSLSRRQQREYQNNLQAYATYHFELGNGVHKFDLLGGYAFEEYRMDRLDAAASKMVTNDFFSLNWGDVATKTNGDYVGSWASMSGYGRLNYNLLDRYLFEANLRYDGSSRLAPESRWKAFPSLSLAWRISEESFMKDMDFITNLKVRGSWGQLGNAQMYSSDNVGYYDYIASLKKGDNLPFNDQRTGFIYQQMLASPNKTWETIETSNLGVDLSVMKGKLSFTGDYYVKRNVNMFAELELPSTIGINVPKFNVGELKTWGWELNLNWQDKIDNFEYWVNFNLHDSQNEVISYNGRNAVREGVNGLIEGMPVNTIYGYKSQGYFQTENEYADYGVFQSNRTGAGDVKYLDLNGDKKISVGDGTMENHGDLVRLGDTSPRYNYGIDLGFKFKGFDFNAFFQGVGKRDILVDTRALMPFFENWRYPWTIHRDYWTPENPDAYWPRLYRGGTHNYLASDKWVQNASYIRLKNLQIGYTLPNRLTSKLNIEKVRVYFSGQDLWEKSDLLSVYDPEAPNNVNFMYPFYRVVSFGVNVNF